MTERIHTWWGVVQSAVIDNPTVQGVVALAVVGGLALFVILRET